MAGYTDSSGSLVIKIITRWLMAIMMTMTTSHEFFVSQNEDPNLSFRYFNQLSDPTMNVYGNRQGYANPHFHKLFFIPSKNVMLLAGLDFLYQLNPENISLELKNRVNLTSYSDFKDGELLAACEAQTKKRSEGMCRNVVQMVYWRSTGDALYVCTSGFGSPREFVVDSLNMQVTNMSAAKDAVGKCSGIPFSTFTSIFIESVLSIFSGSPIRENYKWYFGKYVLGDGMEISNEILSKEQETEIRYVASVEVDEFVYVFLNEVPEEELFFGAEKIFYTRIGRICKTEPGNLMNTGRLTTYVKVRVFCKSTVRPDDVFYNIVTDVFFDEVADKFHLLSSTLQRDASAVCLVDRRSIDAIVSRSELLGKNSSGCWSAITTNLPPQPGPTSCNYGNKLLVGQLKYNLDYNLASRPLDIGADTTTNIFFTKFLVRPLGAQNFIYWMYSPNEKGFLTKIFVWHKQGIPTMRRIATVKLFKHKNQISELHDLKMVNISGKFFIYAVMEKSVVQLSSDMCSGHVKCTTCAVDPQCAWLVKKGKCSSLVDVERGYAGNYLSNPEVDSPLNFCLAETNCSSDRSQKEIFAVSGTNVVVTCDSVCSPDEGSHPVWYYNNQLLFRTSDDDDEEEEEEYAVGKNMRVVGGRDFKLYFLNSTHNFSGIYECRDALSLKVIARTTVNVAKYCTIEGGFEATWRREFNNWCRSYEEYATSFQTWKSQQCSNTDCLKNCCHSN